MSTLIAISVLGVICLVLEIFDLRKVVVPLVLTGLVVAFGFNVMELYTGVNYLDLDSYGMMHDSGYAKGFTILFILLTFFIVLMSPSFYADKMVKITDFVSLKVFMLAGAIAMVSFSNFIMFFIGLEVLSISGYVLASSRPDNIKSNESGMKYFLMGAVSSSFVLFGLALIYGTTASFDIYHIAELLAANDVISWTWMMLGLVMVSVGMLFKISAFPFHFWAPDVYEGSPTLTTALMSTLVKVAAIGSFFCIASGLTVAVAGSYTSAIVIISILTMTVANITALKQQNIKRMMAYSGISHAGFMLMTMIAAPEAGSTVLYYAAAYSFASMTAFAVIMGVCRNGDNEDISNFYGLFSRQPVLAIAMALALMSLGGIPILGGFFAKFFLFREMLSIDQLVLVIAGVINSIIAIYYYFGVINVMFVKELPEEDTSKVPMVYRVVAVGSISLNILIGLFPSIIMSLEL